MVLMSPVCQERALALTGALLHSDGNKACELLCQLHSKGEEISTMLLASDLSERAGFLKCVSWIAEACLCHNLMSTKTVGTLETACNFF